MYILYRFIIQNLRDKSDENAEVSKLPPLLVTCALGASQGTIEGGYDIAAVAQYVYVNIFIYNYIIMWLCNFLKVYHFSKTEPII